MLTADLLSMEVRDRFVVEVRGTCDELRQGTFLFLFEGTSCGLSRCMFMLRFLRNKGFMRKTGNLLQQ